MNFQQRLNEVIKIIVWNISNWYNNAKLLEDNNCVLG